MDLPDDQFAFLNLVTALNPIEILALEKLAEQNETTIADETRRIIRRELINKGLLPEESTAQENHEL
jgi:hypothetical protein